MRTEGDAQDAKTRAGPLRSVREVKNLGQKICERKAEIVTKLSVVREALKEFSAQWTREAAKAVAVAQNERTLALGKDGIGRLKRAIEDHARALRNKVDDELTVERYGDAGDCTSGQVAGVMARRFERGMRRILATVGPILEKAGYKRDEHFLEPDLPDPDRPRRGAVLELPPDLADHLAKLSDLIADLKVLEVKVVWYDREREKGLAAELWDNS